MPHTSDDSLFAGGDRPKANSLQYFVNKTKSSNVLDVMIV